MEQFVGMSKTGSIKEAAEGLKNPQFLIKRITAGRNVSGCAKYWVCGTVLRKDTGA